MGHQSRAKHFANRTRKAAMAELLSYWGSLVQECVSQVNKTDARL